MCINGREEDIQRIQYQWLGADSIVVSSFSFMECSSSATVLAWDKTLLQHSLQVAIMSQPKSKISGQVEYTHWDVTQIQWYSHICYFILRSMEIQTSKPCEQMTKKKSAVKQKCKINSELPHIGSQNMGRSNMKLKVRFPWVMKMLNIKLKSIWYWKLCKQAWTIKRIFMINIMSLYGNVTCWQGVSSLSVTLKVLHVSDMMNAVM